MRKNHSLQETDTSGLKLGRGISNIMISALFFGGYFEGYYA